MFQLSGFELARLEHSHGEGDWHEMNEASPAHDAAEGDPERAWARGRVFRCGSCADEIRVVIPDDQFRASGR